MLFAFLAGPVYFKHEISLSVDVLVMDFQVSALNLI